MFTVSSILKCVIYIDNTSPIGEMGICSNSSHPRKNLHAPYFPTKEHGQWWQKPFATPSKSFRLEDQDQKLKYLCHEGARDNFPLNIVYITSYFAITVTLCNTRCTL